MDAARRRDVENRRSGIKVLEDASVREANPRGPLLEAGNQHTEQHKRGEPENQPHRQEGPHDGEAVRGGPGGEPAADEEQGQDSSNHHGKVNRRLPGKRPPRNVINDGRRRHSPENQGSKQRASAVLCLSLRIKRNGDARRQKTRRDSAADTVQRAVAAAAR